MKPRPYRMEQRQAAVEVTRDRIIEAARAVLTAEDVASFTVDAVARQAGVARMTVYYQFASKGGLLEALSDHLASRGLVKQLRAAFGRPEGWQVFEGVVGAFCGFWASDRLVIRRLRCLAALDADIERSVSARDERRRDAMRAVVTRLAKERLIAAPASPGDLVDLLHAVTSFEMFDALANQHRSVRAITDLVI